jgi:hypothetical protein
MPRREPDVAGQRQLGRARAGDAVQGGDDDLREGLDGIVEAVGDADELQDLVLGVTRPDRGVEDPHGEELRSTPGHDDGLDVLVHRQIIHDALKGDQDAAGEAVLVGRSRERDRGDSVLELYDDLAARSARPGSAAHADAPSAIAIAIGLDSVRPLESAPAHSRICAEARIVNAAPEHRRRGTSHARRDRLDCAGRCRSLRRAALS